MADILDDSLTPEEEALLRGDTTPPEPAEEENQQVSGAEQKGDEPPADPNAGQQQEQPPADPGAGQQPGAQQAPEGDPPGFAEYMAKHKDKTPEELLRLAYQQNQARAEARSRESEAVKAVTQMREAIQRRAQEARERAAREKEEFEEKLRNDPDEAARIAFQKAQERELADQQSRDWDAYIAQQTRIAASVIPNFETTAPEMIRFGTEALSFTEDEMRGIDDARTLVGLYMAMNYSRLMASGVVDMAGNLLVNPQQSAPNGGQPAGQQPGQQPGQQVDPRLAAPPPPKTLSGAPGGPGGAKTIREQVAEALAMADKDFDKLSADQIDAMLRELDGAGR